MKKAAAGLLLAVPLICSGCGAADGEVVQKEEPVILTVLAGQSTSDAGIEDMIDEKIAGMFDNVKLVWECVDWGDNFDNDIRARFAAGDVPDIMIGKAQDVRAYVGTGNLAPVEERCLETIVSEALEAVTIDGVPYGMPYNSWYQGVIYHKEIFRELGLSVPETGMELEAVIAGLEDHQITPFASHYQESWKVGNMAMQFLVNDIFKEHADWGDAFRSGKVDFTGNEAVRESLKNQETIRDHSWSDALTIDQFECDSRFEQGRAAMYLTGSWSMQFAGQYADDAEFGIFPYPAADGNASLLRETNMTFMKSSKTQYGSLIDDIFYALVTDEALMREILDFTQTSSVVETVTPEYESCLKADIDRYAKEQKVIDVAAGNTQLVWSFQKDLASRQLLWLQGELTFDEVCAYADSHRSESMNPYE